MSALSVIFGILIIVLLIPAWFSLLYIVVIKKNRNNIQDKLRDTKMLYKVLLVIAALLFCLGSTIALTYAGSYLITKDHSSSGLVPYKKGGVHRFKSKQ